MNMIEKLRERFLELTHREKIIVIATGIVCLWGAWDRLFWSPLKQQQNQLDQELSNLTQQLSAQQQTAIKLEAGIKVDPNQINKNKLAELDSALIRLQKQISQAGEKFVPPRLMTQALNDILIRNKQLTLLKLDTLPVTTLRQAENQYIPVYIHGLTLTFSGNYLNTLNYLKDLEALSWRINWDSINYQVKNYPIAETTIRAYTLSFEESWLGV